MYHVCTCTQTQARRETSHARTRVQERAPAHSHATCIIFCAAVHVCISAFLSPSLSLNVCEPNFYMRAHLSLPKFCVRTHRGEVSETHVLETLDLTLKELGVQRKLTQSLCVALPRLQVHCTPNACFRAIMRA